MKLRLLVVTRQMASAPVHIVGINVATMKPIAEPRREMARDAPAANAPIQHGRQICPRPAGDGLIGVPYPEGVSRSPEQKPLRVTVGDDTEASLRIGQVPVQRRVRNVPVLSSLLRSRHGT